MSCIAPVADATSIRLDLAATSSHTAPCSARASSPAATRACAARFFIPRSDGYAACGAGAKRLAVARAVPAAVLDAAHRHAQRSSRRRRAPTRRTSGSAARRGPPRPRRAARRRRVGLSTTRSFTDAPSASSLTRRPRAQPSAKATYSSDGRRAEQREDGECAVDVGRADAQRRGQEVRQRGQGRLGRGHGAPFGSPWVAAGRPGLTPAATRAGVRGNGWSVSDHALPLPARTGAAALAHLPSPSRPPTRREAQGARAERRASTRESRLGGRN